MEIYGVRACEWESDYDCFCTTKEIAEREKNRLVDSYGFNPEENKEEVDEFFEINKFKVITE